jgi:hypothetical protein
MFRIFDEFLKKMKANFQRIARATQHEKTIEELQSDAWIAAHEMGEKRGREIDFSDPADQNLILGAVRVRNVWRSEKHMWYATSIDETSEDEDGAAANPWANRLQATEDSDPLISLLRHESAIDTKAMLADSYSQAAAYVMVFVRFKNDRQAVCTYLVVSDGTLARRVNVAADTVRVQPSLFDRIERIEEDFMPPRGRQYAVKIEHHREAVQWGWDFN